MDFFFPGKDKLDFLWININFNDGTTTVTSRYCHSTAQYHQVPQYHCSDTIMAPSVPSSTTMMLPPYTST